MDLISVIVPVYNVEKYLDRCVESIVNQTYTNLEIILVDDGSPDGCPAMCDFWAKKDRRIKAIHKKNGGLSDARNVGVSISSGEYIGFVDSDDWIAPEMYERLYESIQRSNSDISACSVQMVWENSITPNRMLVQPQNLILNREDAIEALIKETAIKAPVWYKLYNYNLLRGITFKKGKYHEDDYWSYQVVDRAERISIIEYLGYYYWQRVDSIMGKPYSLNRLDQLEAYCERCDYYFGKERRLYNLALLSLWEACIFHGVMARGYLEKEDRRKTYSIISEIKEKYPIKKEAYKKEKISHKLWIEIAKISFPLVCEIKHWLRVGW